MRRARGGDDAGDALPHSVEERGPTPRGALQGLAQMCVDVCLAPRATQRWACLSVRGGPSGVTNRETPQGAVHAVASPVRLAVQLDLVLLPPRPPRASKGHARQGLRVPVPRTSECLHRDLALSSQGLDRRADMGLNISVFVRRKPAITAPRWPAQARVVLLSRQRL